MPAIGMPGDPKLTAPTNPDVVLLIHGTGAGAVEDCGTRWWQPGSQVWCALDEQLADAARCDPGVFHWSGKNSEHARRVGAAALLEHLRRLEMQGQPYHLIGHSHGGSIIWMALGDATASGVRLQYLRSWTTFGTPFLKFAPERIAWWFLLPLVLVPAAAVLNVNATSQASPAATPWNAGNYLRHALELWELGQNAALFGLPILYLILSAVLAWSLFQGWIILRSRFTARRDRGLDDETYRRYGPCYLGIWSLNDEAINGLARSLRLEGEVTPRWQPPNQSVLYHYFSWLFWPVLRIYNAMFARASDEFIWSRVARRIQGNDRSGFELTSVASKPCLALAGWPPLPPGVDRDLIEMADRSASTTLAAIRTALGVNALAEPNSPNVITGVARVVTFHELVHTSYYLSPSVNQLVAAHVRLNSTSGPEGCSAVHTDPVLAAWYATGCQQARQTVEPAPAIRQPWASRFRALFLVQGFGLAFVTVLTWSALSSLYRSYVDVLTDESQVEVVLSKGRDVAPSVYWSERRPWLVSQAALGRVSQAEEDAMRLSTPNLETQAQGLTCVAATLRVLGKSDEAARIETRILELANRIEEKQSRTYAVAPMASELASFGILRQDLLAPDLIPFARENVISAVAQELAQAGHPDLARQLVPLHPKDRNYEYAAAVEAITTALIRLGRANAALEFAKQVSPEKMPRNAKMIEVYAANGLWDEAETCAERISAGGNPDRAFSVLARLHSDAGNAAKCLEAARKVRSWQYQAAEAAHVAPWLASSGHPVEAKQIAVQFIRDNERYDNPWWNVQQLIQNQRSLREAGAAAELEAAKEALLEKCRSKYGGNKRHIGDEEVLGRAVITFLEIGDIEGASAHVRKFPMAESRATYLPLVSSAFVDAKQTDRAEE